MNDSRIPCYSEQEHYTDIDEPETIEDADISPHVQQSSYVQRSSDLRDQCNLWFFGLPRTWVDKDD